jgi:predicted outer membrane protein
MIRSNYLASAAIAALLALPAAAFAQTAPSATTTPPAPAAAASPMSSHPVPGGNAEQRVEAHIRQLHAQLRITSAEQPQWEQFANVMRENARAMDQEFAQRMQQYPTMNALQNMESYEQIAEAHAQHLQKLVPAFENLYNTMPDQQKQLTDQVFRQNAETNAQKRTQTGSNTAQ